MRLLLFFLLLGCAGSAPERVCEPGEPAACTCPDGAPGERRCLATGAGYASCTCPPPSGDVEPGPQRAVRTNEEVETNGADDVGEPPASEDSTAGDSTAGDTAPEDTSAEDTAAAETPPTSPDEASAPGGAPTVFTRISFDLRGMPHRGPHDVDPARIDGRVQLLMQRVRDAAGLPAPRLTHQRGSSVFRAEFHGPLSEALARCRRVVAEVAPPPPEPASGRVSRRAAFRGPDATPCAPIEPEGSGPM
ncbi:MAG TPA: hypothetical protein RMH85_17355 [Polyangiaceae bacterium LLY-WYZ-15_(1-7)]|nr:hypothetical protein [Sandaracinus sp.]HJL02057.1 hypothetical protein [Polyangiaceae bacterium LLY-WYZ-15_(1-7)]MBJ71442.1 hypothetical protein [Sandaracinus sp.]HJL10270.1 hypothetical protein [Polyangiaceae bacterium LLY-WYZ-15_(1-7)]HJL23884.1 hypothetical protein [Polyangiaceae bacterium LLY-WYZ-15_(1-7)]